ncbi:hypothetical protein MMPV_002115 [Pyropia vietnamensis]
MAPATKKATGTAVVTALVALSVAPSIHGAPTSDAARAAVGASTASSSLHTAAVEAPAGAAPRRLTAEALAALDVATRQEGTPPPPSSSAVSSAHSSAASEHSSHAEDEASSHASDAESAASDLSDELGVPTPVTGEADSDASGDTEAADCFPGDATTELADGRVVAMADLEVGDIVRVAPGDGPAAFSAVFLFTHKIPTSPRTFVRLTTASGARLDASAGHYVYANGRLVAASAVAVGDTLQVATPAGWADSTVTATRRVTASGLYNPQTLHGDIVVGGVRVSTYTTAVQPTVASALLAPLRAVYRTTGLSMKALEGGGGALTSLVPRGKAVC